MHLCRKPTMTLRLAATVPPPYSHLIATPVWSAAVWTSRHVLFAALSTPRRPAAALRTTPAILAFALGGFQSRVRRERNAVSSTRSSHLYWLLCPSQPRVWRCVRAARMTTSRSGAVRHMQAHRPSMSLVCVRMAERRIKKSDIYIYYNA